MTVVTDHYSAPKVVTWVSAIVIPFVAGFAWVANTAISVNERIARNSYKIGEMSKNQSKLLDIVDQLNGRVIESRTWQQSIKENQAQMMTDIRSVVETLRKADEK